MQPLGERYLTITDINQFKASIKKMRQNETERLTKVETKMDYMQDKVDHIEKMLADFIKSSDSKYAPKDQFNFWRNVLISGIIVTIFVGILNMMLLNFYAQ